MDDDFFSFPSIDLKQVEASFGVNSDSEDRSDDEIVDKLIQRTKHKPLGRYATAPAQLQSTQTATGKKSSAPLETISSESEDDVEAILRKTASQGYVPSDPMMTAGAMDSVRRHQEAMFNLKRKLSAPAVVPAERVMVTYDDDEVQIVSAKRAKLPDALPATTPTPTNMSTNSTSSASLSSSSRPASPSAVAQAANNALIIKIRLNDEQPSRVKVLKTTTFDRILAGFCKQKGIDPSHIRLSFDGLEVGRQQTPEQLDVEADDLFEATSISMPKAPVISSAVPAPIPAHIPAPIPAPAAAQRPTERRIRAALVDRAPPAHFHLHYPPPPTAPTAPTARTVSTVPAPIPAAVAPAIVTSRPSRKRKQAAQVPVAPLPAVVAPAAVQTIVLTIQDEQGTLLKVKAFTNTPFSTIFGAWCKQKNRVLSALQFVAKSRTLESHRSPGDYGLSEQDTIVVQAKR